MTETLVLDLLALASALFYGAGSERGRARLPWLGGPRRAFAARSLALLLCVLAIACWRRIEPGPAAFLVVPVGVMALGTCIALLAPFAPRALGPLALCSALALPALLLAGAAP